MEEGGGLNLIKDYYVKCRKPKLKVLKSQYPCPWLPIRIRRHDYVAEVSIYMTCTANKETAGWYYL